MSTITGETTTIAAREQSSLLKVNHPNALNVREAFMDDLGLILRQERAEGREILIIADGNSTGTHDEFVIFFKKYDMTDLVPDDAPPTCSRSRVDLRPTEIAFGTRAFSSTLKSVGFYPFYHFNGSDHREIELVFEREPLFQGGLTNTWHKRTINPRNPKHTKQFNEILRKLHKKSDTLKSLHKIEKDLQSNDESIRHQVEIKANNIAKRSLFEFIHHANKKVAAPVPAMHIPWLPILKHAKQAMYAAAVSARDNGGDDTFQEAWRNATIRYKDIKGNASEHRKQYLEDRKEEMALLQNCSKESAHKQILDCEMSSDLHSKNRFLLKGPHSSMMQSVLVPSGQGYNHTMAHDQAKEEGLLRYNERHLQQSNISPFAHGPLSNLIGHDTSNSEILHTLTDDEIENISNEYGHVNVTLSKVLKRLKKRETKDGTKADFQWKFDGEDYRKSFGRARYNIAPGFSGLSMIHLRTISRDKHLSEISAKLLELPFRYGFTYDHWLKSVQALLQKESLPLIHRLRILELLELDYNGMLKYLIGRHFAKYEQSNGFQNKESYGAVRKKSAHDGLASVINTMEYSHIVRKPMVVAPKDATGCFDLLGAEAIKPIQESKGLPASINTFRIKVLQNME